MSAENHTVNNVSIAIEETFASTSRSQWIYGLVNGESYTWTVSAYNDQGFGNFSAVSSVGIPGTKALLELCIFSSNVRLEFVLKTVLVNVRIGKMCFLIKNHNWQTNKKIECTKICLQSFAPSSDMKFATRSGPEMILTLSRNALSAVANSENLRQNQIFLHLKVWYGTRMLCQKTANCFRSTTSYEKQAYLTVSFWPRP